MFLVDLAAHATTNLTAIDRVSFYNTGLFFWPGDPTKLGFQAIIDGNSHPFRTDHNGQNKHDLTKDSRDFAYGFSASPDGRKIAYHKSYQVYVADSDGSNTHKVPTGQPFNFAPQWSADGRHLLFVAGEHHNCHRYIVNSDGNGFRKLADRGGYDGVIAFLDVLDFHSGSSDIPVWSTDGRSVFYTVKAGKNVELYRVTLEGQSERLTQTPEGSLHYHPQPSPDGRWVAYGSKRDGVRQLNVTRLADRSEYRITRLEKGRAAMWPQWQHEFLDCGGLPPLAQSGSKLPHFRETRLRRQAEIEVGALVAIRNKQQPPAIRVPCGIIIAGGVRCGVARV